jgi:CIC family chloride channel protein
MIQRLNEQWRGRMRDLEEGATFLRKWGLLGLLIGAGTGVGALCLIWLIQLFNRYFLEVIVGYAAPSPGGEGGHDGYVFHASRLWLLPAVTTVIGLVGGFLTWKLAPETAGIGTNAAIKAFHANERLKPKSG